MDPIPMDPIQRCVEKWLNIKTCWVYITDPYISTCQVIIGGEEILFDNFFFPYYRSLLRAFSKPRRVGLYLRICNNVEYELRESYISDKNCSEKESLQDIRKQFIKLLREVPLNTSIHIGLTSVISQKTILK